MAYATSEQFYVSDASWLGQRLDSKIQFVCSLSEALAFECKPNKGELPDPALRSALSEELLVIDASPGLFLAIRGDGVESAWASEMRTDKRPSVDVFVAHANGLLLVECKYRAIPETGIVKSVRSFQENVSRKFQSSIAFLTGEGARLIVEEKIVLFNSESIDKVLSMFERLKNEDDAEELMSYRLMDTRTFYEFCFPSEQ